MPASTKKSDPENMDDKSLEIALLLLREQYDQSETYSRMVDIGKADL